MTNLEDDMTYFKKRIDDPAILKQIELALQLAHHDGELAGMKRAQNIYSPKQ